MFYLGSAVAVVLMVFGFSLFRQLRRAADYRLGIDGNTLLLAEGDDQVHRIDPAEVRFDRNNLIWTRHIIPLRAGLAGWLVTDKDREHHLMPLLDAHGRKRNSLQIMFDMLTQDGRKGMALKLVAIVLPVCVLVLALLWGR
jgi:hypothetical protein